MFNLFEIKHELADVWIAYSDEFEADYYYGGTRMVSPGTETFECHAILQSLMLYESALKNRLINFALQNRALDHLASELPVGFLSSKVGGARCVIRPSNAQTASIMRDPTNPDFVAITESVFEPIGQFLNCQKGKIKLTPDFGRFAGLADILVKFTPHALGIKCEGGGCGGKSSYSATGIIAAIQSLDLKKDTPITHIGSAGAMGTDVLKYLIEQRFEDLAVCDLAYENGINFHLPQTVKILKAVPKTFTDECLRRGGAIIATTVGNELENSNWQIIPPNSHLILAHNLAIPANMKGIQMMKKIAENKVLAIPGQILTLGGALTSRIEWFFRASNPQSFFNKPLAHQVVKETVPFLMKDVIRRSSETRQSPYEVTLSFLDFDEERISKYQELSIGPTMKISPFTKSL
jgi:hypothetical protein